MDGRVEHKYLVPNELLDDIRADLRPYVLPDPLGGKQRDGEYTVRSIYYDTPHLECYDTKLDGLKVRRKFRIRGYDQPTDDSIVFLEIKKKYDSFIAKHRSPLLRRHLEEFLASPDLDRYILQTSGAPCARQDAERFLYHYYRKGLLPVVLVVYDREAFLGRFDPSLRLTFDKSLRRAALPTPETLYDDHGLESAMPDASIFEVKFFRQSVPGFVKSIIHRYRLPRLALSKYAMCLEAGVPTPTFAPQRLGHLAAALRRV